MGLENWHNTFLIIAWLGAVIGAVGAVGSWKTGQMIGSAKDQQISTLETQVQHLEPRKLTETQENTLILELNKYDEAKRVGFYSRMMDRESAEFADSLAEVFKKAGWDVSPTNKSSLNDYPGFLTMFRVGNPPASLPGFLQNAFQKIGVDCRAEHIKEGSISGKREDDKVYIVVGSKI